MGPSPAPPPPLGGRARDGFRHGALWLIEGSRLGSGAAAVASRVPRRSPHDTPDGIVLRPFQGRRLALLAHYHPQGEVDAGFRHLITSIGDLGYSVVVSTTAPTSAEAFAEKLEGTVCAVVARANEGFDFQSWRRGIEFAKYRSWDFQNLILVNGSMYGPLGPLDHVISRMDRFGSWGMTESMDLRRHIQSWWLAFGPAVISHPGFDRYWRRVRPASNKWGTILTHELNWADDLSLAGPTRAYVTLEQHGCLRNPLFFAWRELIEDWQMPFVKRSLFDQNYDRIDMTGWQDFLARVAPAFDQSMIDA